MAFSDAGVHGQVCRLFISSSKPDRSGRCRSALVAAHHKFNTEEVAGSVPRQDILAMLLALRMLQLALKIKKIK